MDSIQNHHRWVTVAVLGTALFLCMSDQLDARAVQEDARESYALAASHYSNQNWRQAVDQFQKLIAEFPRSDQAIEGEFYLGESLVQLREHHAASTRFKSFVESNPGHSLYVRALFRVAESHYLAGEFQESKAAFLRFMTEHDADPLAEFALPYLGELHFRDEKFSASRDAFQLALKHYPASSLSNQCRIGLANSLARLGESDQAERFYRFVANQKNHDLADDAQLSLGKLKIQQGDWPSAQAALEVLIRGFPDSELVPQARYTIARHKLSQGQWEECWGDLQSVLQADLDDTLHNQVALDAAVVGLRLNKADQARDLVQAIEQRNPDHAIREILSVVEIDLANRDKDFLQLKKLVERFETAFPNSPHTTRCIEPLARMHYDRGEFDEACQRYQHLINLVMLNPELDGNLPAWRYLLGLSKIGTGEFDVALTHLKSISDFSDSDTFKAATSFAIATALVGEERWAESVPVYKEYLQIQPDGPDAIRCHADLAIAQVKCGKLSDAVQQLENVNGLQRNDHSVLAACELIAEAAMEKQDKDLARRFFNWMANSSRPEYQSRGTNGLLWTNDPLQSNGDTVRQALDAGVDTELALEAIMGQIQQMQAKGKHENVVKLLTGIVKEYPNSRLTDQARFRLAVSMQRLSGAQRSRQAAALFNEFLKRNPNDKLAELARYELAWALHDSGNVSGAQQQFSEIFETRTDSPYRIDAGYRSAMLSRQNNDHNSMVARLNDMIQLDPDHALAGYAWYSLGELDCQKERWSTAATAFSKVLESSADESLKQPARYWLAEAFFQQGEIDSAKRQFDEIKESRFDKPEINSAIWLRLAQCAAKKADWKQVEKLVGQLRQSSHPGVPGYQLEYLDGRVAMSRARLGQARALFKKVLNDKNASATNTAAMSQWMIGESWFHQQNYDQALKAYMLVDSLYDFDQWRSLAMLQAAKCHLHLGNPRAATRTCQRMMKEFPNSSHASQVGQLLMEIEKVGGKKLKGIPANFSR